MMEESKNENIVIWAGWAMIFASPAFYLYYESAVDDAMFDSFELLKTWRMLLPFLVVFVIHHYLLIRLYDRRMFVVYAVCCLSVMALHTWHQVTLHNDMPRHFDGGMHHHHEPLHGMRHKPSHHPFRPLHGEFQPKHVLLRAPVMSRIVMALLIMGMDLGVASLNNSRRARNRVLALEREKLAMELDYLKYQVNPHFFMNTLNNIHALIDIDREKAQRTIIDLSKLMRYVLYDSTGDMVPLDKDLQFIQLYISLMRLRFSSDVDIKVCLPQDMSGITVPPLLFICFVENAFKHGVSSRHQSFVNLQVTTDEKREYLYFMCVNSIHDQQRSDGHHGIGIENARKRLGLIYGENHTLEIMKNTDNTFTVWLQIPISARG